MGMIFSRQRIMALALSVSLVACSEKEDNVTPKFAAEDRVVLVENMPACTSPGDIVRFAEHFSRKEYSAAWNTKPSEPFCASDEDTNDRQRWTVLYVRAPLVAIGIVDAVDYEQHSSLNDRRYKLTYFTHQEWLERAPDKK